MPRAFISRLSVDPAQNACEAYRNSLYQIVAERRIEEVLEVMEV